MNHDDLAELRARLRRLEDESAIPRLIMSYGPAADAGLTTFAAGLWLEDGEYDWDANGEPHHGSVAVDAMLQSDGHRQLIAEGVAHFGGPLLVEVDGDRATAVNYSLIMRREGNGSTSGASARCAGTSSEPARRGECGAARTVCSTRPAPAGSFSVMRCTSCSPEAAR